MSSDEKVILLCWQASSNFGWGIAGLNIFFHWSLTPDLKPMMMFPIQEDDLRMIDPLRLKRMQPHIEFNNVNAQRILDAIATQIIELDIPVIHSLGNSFSTNHQGRIGGKKNIARTVFEDTNIAPIVSRLDPYGYFLTCSQWNTDLLRAQVKKPVHLIHESIDPSLFFPGPKSGLLDPGLFYIFTGGKIEFRKGQDLVLLAFREFSRRHNDAMLITSWQSPWPKMAAGFQGKLNAPLTLAAEKTLNTAKWVADNGVDPARVFDIGTVPNQLFPMVLREMDCALQPSRAEGGTNFVAMEAMACGLPVILADNTGVRDIIRDDNCIPLRRQSPAQASGPMGVEGWGESDVEEIIDALERLYASTELRRKTGVAAAAFMKDRTWAAHAQQLKDWVLSL